MKELKVSSINEVVGGRHGRTRTRRRTRHRGRSRHNRGRH